MKFRCLIALIAIVCATPVRAADWPRYHGPDNNGISRETGLLKSWPASGPKLVWKAPLGIGYSSIAVAGGRVFTMFQDKTNQYVVAFDEKSGDQLWKQTIGPIFDADDSHDGPRSTPTVDGKLVYAIGGNGELACLNASDGKPVWQKNILKLAGSGNITWGIAQSPFIYKNMVLTNPGGTGSAFIALDKKTGEIVWKSGTAKAGYSTPVISHAGGVEQILFFAGRELVGVQPGDGKVLWSYPWANGSEVNAASPIPVGDAIFISSDYGRGASVIQIDLTKPQPATKVWDNKSMLAHFGTPILLDGCLYGYKMGALTCVDFKTGQIKWIDNNGDMPPKGQITYAEGLFYVLGENGTMALAQMSPSGFKKISEFEISPGAERWAPLTIANGRLYMRDDKQLYCLDIKAAKN